jgi:hypothetical protein
MLGCLRVKLSGCLLPNPESCSQRICSGALQETIDATSYTCTSCCWPDLHPKETSSDHSYTHV